MIGCECGCGKGLQILNREQWWLLDQFNLSLQLCHIDLKSALFSKINLDRVFKTKSISTIEEGSDIFWREKIISGEISAVELTQMDL